MERMIETANPLVFWLVWVIVFAIALPSWMYGELGTFHGWPYAPLVWIVGFITGGWLGWSCAVRIS